MTNLQTLKSEKEKVEKGCGRLTYGKLGLEYYCGSITLCPTCQARLEEKNKAIQAVENTIKDEIEFLNKVIHRNRVNIPTTKEQFERIIKERKTCQICNKSEMIHDLDLHHIIPKRNGGKSNDDNLFLICGNCHKIIESLLYSGDVMAKRIVKERLSQLQKEMTK